MPMRRISEKLVHQRLKESECLSETYVIGGNEYWKYRGTCWTQSKGDRSTRKQISDEEYRDAITKSKGSTSSDLPSMQPTNLVPKDVQSSMVSYEDLSYYLGDNDTMLKKEQQLHKDTAKLLGVPHDSLVGANLEYSEDEDVFRDLINKSNQVSSHRGTNNDFTKVYKSPDGVKFAVYTDSRREQSIMIPTAIPHSEPKKEIQSAPPQEKKPAPPKKKKVTPTPAPTKSTKPKTSFLDVWRESSDAVMDLAHDYETVATVSGKSIIVDLGDKDLNNKKLIKKLEKSGYVQYSRFRWRYDHN